MLNQIVLVGRLMETPVVEEGKVNVTIAVPRSFKNEAGEYETDFIPVTLFNGVATNTAEYCKKGDMVGVKGRMQSVEGKLELVAEKVTFLTSSRKSENE